MNDIRAAVVAEIARLQKVLKLLDEKVNPRPERKKRNLSAASRQQITKAQRERWAKNQEGSCIAKGLISPSPSHRNVQPAFGSIFSNFAILARMLVTVTSPPVTVSSKVP